MITATSGRRSHERRGLKRNQHFAEKRHARLFPEDHPVLRPNLPITRYFLLWDSIYAKQDHCQFAAYHNPTVYRHEFRVLPA